MSALHRFEISMKQQTLASFNFKKLSNDQDKPSPSTSEENTDESLPSTLDTCGPKNTVMFHFNETTD